MPGERLIQTAITITSGNNFIVQFDATNGVLALA
jgi:hypothetical protein